MKNADMPAMTSGALYDESAEDVIPHRGLTKREHFAAMALQGILSDPDGQTSIQAVKTSVLYADALLAALEDN